jgi:dihydrofolate reductase
MRRIIYVTMVSLDGYIEGPHRELDWHIIDEELHTYVNDQQRAIGAYLYGRRMYEVMAAYWPTADADPSAPAYIVDFAHLWQNTPKIVFSKTLEQVVGPNTRLVKEDAIAEITRLKEQPGKALGLGGADLAGAVARQGLIDEYHFYIQPVLLGAGKRLFSGLDAPLNLRLVETHRFGSGVILLRYTRADTVE